MRRILCLLVFFPFLGVAVFAGEDPAPSARGRVGLVRVPHDGTYLLTKEALDSVGIGSPLRAEVRRGGRPVPMVTGRAGVAKAALAFAALDVATPYSRYAVYELWALDTPREPTPAGIHEAVALRRELARDWVLGELGAASPATYDPPRGADRGPLPVWFAGYAPRGKTATFSLGPMGADRDAPQVLEAEVYANGSGLIVVNATWDGHDLGKAAAPGAVGGATLQWALPASALPGAPAGLVLRNDSPAPPPPPRYDVSAGRGTIFIDRVRLTGKARFEARWKDARPVPVEAAGAPADPLGHAGDARHVILATPALVEPAERLAAHRTRSGLASAVVPVTEVYDRYGHGEASPDAIKAFVADLRARKDAPLAYLLLAGDATLDRTDLIEAVTLPTPMARTMYNGATAADRLYAPYDPITRIAPAIGRLPFRAKGVMSAYVDRVIGYETDPPNDATRRMLRFLTSPGRFGAYIDGLIEGFFKGVVAKGIPPAYDTQATYASESSPYLWPPPEFSQKVLDELSEGSLFFTYVGHGYAQGFDTLRVGAKRYPILHVADATRVHVRGTPPVMFVLACTTARFDMKEGRGIGEALLAQPEGPIAYWGATRICHPGFNALMGEAIARRMAQGTDRPRLGTILAASLEQAHTPTTLAAKARRTLIGAMAGVPADRLLDEGALMYTLLGDPALRVAFPETDLTVAADRTEDGRALHARVTGPLPAGTKIVVTLERPRNKPRKPPHEKVHANNPEDFGKIRENHRAVNDLTITRVEAIVTQANVVEVALPLLPGDPHQDVVLKAWAVGKDFVRQGATWLK